MKVIKEVHEYGREYIAHCIEGVPCECSICVTLKDYKKVKKVE